MDIALIGYLFILIVFDISSVYLPDGLYHFNRILLWQNHKWRVFENILPLHFRGQLWWIQYSNYLLLPESPLEVGALPSSGLVSSWEGNQASDKQQCWSKASKFIKNLLSIKQVGNSASLSALPDGGSSGFISFLI